MLRDAPQYLSGQLSVSSHNASLGFSEGKTGMVAVILTAIFNIKPVFLTLTVGPLDLNADRRL